MTGSVGRNPPERDDNVGLYTIHFGHRPWHLVQVNADRYSVPLNRIRRPIPR